MFKANQVNLEDAKLAIEQFGECWLHGCGNIYVDKVAHEFRAKYANPLHNGNAAAGAYFVHFTSVDQVPDTIEKLNATFHATRTRQMQEAADKENKVIAPVAILKRRPVVALEEAATANDLEKTASTLEAKTAHLSARETLIDETEIELELKQQAIENKEAALLDAAEKVKEAAKALAAREAAIAAKEEELKKQAPALAKKTPAANS